MATLTVRLAHRTIISYCIDRGMTPIQTLREMGKTCHGHWCIHGISALKQGRTAEKRGRPKKNQAVQMKKIKDILDEDRCQTVRLPKR